MNILFTNDDGYDAPGINTLYNEFRNSSNIYMCAPLLHKSGFSHAIDHWSELELIPLEKENINGFALNGSPADCSMASCMGLFNLKFDLVLSGINYGINAAQDIFYSGTVGAAREASFQGVLAFALSQEVPAHSSSITPEIQERFEFAAKIVKRIVESMPKDLLDYKGSIININFPYTTDVKGILLTVPGRHSYNTRLEFSEKEGSRFLRFRGDAQVPLTGEGTDTYHLNQGYIVVSALKNGIIIDTELQEKLRFLENISTNI